MEHIGLKLSKSKYSYHLVREEFALINTKPSMPYQYRLMKEKNAYTDTTGVEYRKEWCEEYRELCLENFDLNMRYFKSLDLVKFNSAFDSFVKKHYEFQKVDDLSSFENISGYYIMVLDEYRQIYIGKSGNIKKRIRQHWTATKPFDKTLFPMYAHKTSCFSIDFFRPLDTTRLFVWKTHLIEGMEDKLLSDLPQEFCVNRIGGDISSALEAIATMKKIEL